MVKEGGPLKKALLIGSVLITISGLIMLMLVASKDTVSQPKANQPHHPVPTQMTAPWYETLSVHIDNPKLIEAINKSNYAPSFFTLGVKGSIFIGRWLLTCSIDDVQTVPYFMEITNDVSLIDQHAFMLKKLPRLSVKEKRDVLDVVKYKQPETFQKATSEWTLGRDFYINIYSNIDTYDPDFCCRYYINRENDDRGCLY